MALVQAGPDKLWFVAGERLASLFAADDPALEWPLIEWATQFLDPNKTFVDIGAHVGTWALSYARKVPRVVAFEAERKNYHRLVAGVALNEFWNVECHHAAVTNSFGQPVTLNVGVHDWSGFGGSVANFPINGETRAETVPSARLDSMKLPNIGLVKIDVEGHERAVLDGMRQTLVLSGNPPLLVECWSAEVFPWYADERQRTLACLAEMGYAPAPINGWPHMLLCAHP